MRIGKGEKLQDILNTSKGVVEGLPTLELVRKHSVEQQLDMPITKVVYDLIFSSIPIEEAT